MTRFTVTRFTAAFASFPVLLLAGLSAHAAPPAGGPVHLHLRAERKTQTIDAQGHSKIVWTALDAPSAVHPGDVLRYDVSAENSGAVPVSGLVVTQPVPGGTAYVAHSAEAAKNGLVPAYSLDGRQFSAQPVQAGPNGVSRPAAPEAYAALRWRFPVLPPHTSQDVTYLVKVR